MVNINPEQIQYKPRTNTSFRKANNVNEMAKQWGSNLPIKNFIFTESSGNIGLIKLKETYCFYNLNNFINNKLRRMCPFVVISQNISELLY